MKDGWESFEWSGVILTGGETDGGEGGRDVESRWDVCVWVLEGNRWICMDGM